MKKCKKYQKDIAAYLYNELSEAEQRLLESHLQACPFCRSELAAAKQVLTAADGLCGDIDAAMAKVDWEQLPNIIADQIAAPATVGKRSGSSAWLRPFLFQPRFRPVFAALFVGILLGTILTLTFFRAPSAIQIAQTDLNVPQGILENMEIEMARQDTLDYLEKSRYLLLDFVQSSPDQAAGFWQSDYVVHRAGDLLSRKKYINMQLGNYRMAKAKAVCDQIELLFIELTRISSVLSMEELENIRAYIEDRQLLLKINLIKKELKQSEI